MVREYLTAQPQGRGDVLLKRILIARAFIKQDAPDQK